MQSAVKLITFVTSSSIVGLFVGGIDFLLLLMIICLFWCIIAWLDCLFYCKYPIFALSTKLDISTRQTRRSPRPLGRDKKMSQLIISHIENALYNMAFLDIKKASIGNSKIGAFILASCFIDYMAGFVCGHQTTRNEGVKSPISSFNLKTLKDSSLGSLIDWIKNR